MIGLLAALASAGFSEGVRINLNPHTVEGHDNNGSPWTYEAGFIVRNTGVLGLTADGTSTVGDGEDSDEWLNGARPDTAYASDFECLVSETSQAGGGSRSGTMDTWIDCATANSNRTWNLDNGAAADADWVVTLKIRHKVSQIEYGGTVTITLKTVDAFS